MRRSGGGGGHLPRPSSILPMSQIQAKFWRYSGKILVEFGQRFNNTFCLLFVIIFCPIEFVEAQYSDRRIIMGVRAKKIGARVPIIAGMWPISSNFSFNRCFLLWTDWQGLHGGGGVYHWRGRVRQAVHHWTTLYHRGQSQDCQLNHHGPCHHQWRVSTTEKKNLYSYLVIHLFIYLFNYLFIYLFIFFFFFFFYYTDVNKIWLQGKLFK